MAALSRAKPEAEPTTVMTSVVRGLHALSARRIVVATPYLDEVNDYVLAFLSGHGFEVLAVAYPGGYPGLSLEHGAVLETSMMLYLFPHLVDVSRISDDPPADFPPYDLYPGNPDWVPPSGCLAPAHGSSAEIGKRLVDEFTDLVSGALAAEFRTAQAVGGAQGVVRRHRSAVDGRNPVADDCGPAGDDGSGPAASVRFTKV